MWFAGQTEAGERASPFVHNVPTPQHRDSVNAYRSSPPASPATPMAAMKRQLDEMQRSLEQMQRGAAAPPSMPKIAFRLPSSRRPATWVVGWATTDRRI